MSTRRGLKKRSESFQDGYWDGFYWDAMKPHRRKADDKSDYDLGYEAGIMDGPQKSGFDTDAPMVSVPFLCRNGRSGRI